MAKAAKTRMEIVKPVEVEAVQLTLSMEEARVIQTILAFVGGHHIDSPRKITEDISNALCEHVGYPSACAAALKRAGVTTEGGIYFGSYPEDGDE